ncbi:MAG: hypothetical protein K0R09_1713 [Clostridiales bacterium]|nr:hypothetical protein [Clostridiales bacterium]
MDEKANMTYYKGKVLNLIMANPRKYSLWDIENIFGLSRDKIEQFTSEYNKMGIEIQIRKGKLLIKESEKMIEVFHRTAKNQESDLYIFYKSIRKNSLGDKKMSIDKLINGLHNPPINKSNLIKKINYLERDGLVFLKNGYIHLLEPQFESLEDEKILKLLIFINVVRNLYPKRNLLNSIFRKLLEEYENRGFKLNVEAVQYINKCKMSLYDEVILNIVEEAIYYDKSLEFSYRTQVGAMKIKINPAGIIYNNQKDMWYVVTIGERSTQYRMDKMTRVSIVEGGAGRFARNLYEHSMGISGESLTDVKAAFSKEDYIYKKLLNYIKLRKSAGIRETNNAYILTDRVCGTNEFKKWIRVFGEKAICLKPDKLREEMLKDVKLLKDRYGVV